MLRPLLLITLTGCIAYAGSLDHPLPLKGTLTGAAGIGAPQRYAGLFTTGFEQSSFRPCGTPEQWWVTRVPPELKLPTGGAPLGTTVYVEWTARLSKPGRYGHLGGYTREITPLKVLVQRPGAQCPKRAP